MYASIFTIIALCILTSSSLQVQRFNSLNVCNIYQGFGCQSDYFYSAEILVKNQSQFHNAVLRNFSKVVFPSLLTFILQKQIVISNANNIIISGSMQLWNYGISVINCSNIIIQNIRIFNASIDAILISNSHNVIINHNTLLDSARDSIQRGKNIDVTQNSSNVTISQNIIGYTADIQKMIKNKGFLVFNFYEDPVTNISIHHNVFYCNYQRSPQISPQNITKQGRKGCLFDFYQNIVFNWTQYGTRIRGKAYGNSIQNLYIGERKDPLAIDVDKVQKQGIYSESNLLLKNKVYTNIQNILTHQKYQTPFLSSRQYKTVLTESGAKTKGKWQVTIRKNIEAFMI